MGRTRCSSSLAAHLLAPAQLSSGGEREQKALLGLPASPALRPALGLGTALGSHSIPPRALPASQGLARALVHSPLRPPQPCAHVGAAGRRRVFFKVSARFFPYETQGCAIFLVSI